MKKLLTISVLIIQSIFLFSQDLRVVKFIDPMPATSNIPVNTSVDWTVRIKNYGYVDVPVGDTIGVFSSLYSNGQWTSPTLVGAVILDDSFKVGDSMEITTPVTYYILPGLRSLRFAAIWASHVPDVVYNLQASFNFISPSGFELNTGFGYKVYYNNGRLYINTASSNQLRTNLKIYNFKGQLLYEDEIRLYESNCIAMFQMQGCKFPNGIYIAEISNSEMKKTVKFMIH